MKARSKVSIAAVSLATLGLLAPSAAYAATNPGDSDTYHATDAEYTTFLNNHPASDGWYIIGVEFDNGSGGTVYENFASKSPITVTNPSGGNSGNESSATPMDVLWESGTEEDNGTNGTYISNGQWVSLRVDNTQSPSSGSTTSTTNVSGGTLSVTAPSITAAFPDVVLNGKPQTVTATLGTWQVDDARGTGDGWHVVVSGTQLTEVLPSGATSTPLTLPKGSLSFTGTPTISADTGATPVDPTNGPVFENTTTPIDNGPVTILDTQPNYGMGSYTITSPSNGLSLSLVPSTTKVDPVNYPNGQPTPYQSVITFEVVSGS